MGDNTINRNITTVLPTYPYPAYESNKIVAGYFAGLIGISLIGWIVQSILIRFQPLRLNILILLSHLTIFIHLVLRATLSIGTSNSRAGFTAMTVLLAVSLRTIIFANYDFLVRVWELKKWISRALLIGPAVAALTSTILMAPANSLGYNPDTVERSFRLRKASTAIVLGLTILFYPIWFATKTVKHMNKLAIIFLIISSICCLIVGIFLVVSSIPKYYIRSNEQELWIYIFQIIPIIVALFTWMILHPKRTLVEKQKVKKETEHVTVIYL